MDGKKRIALYGGTFDPIHLGHLEVARQVSRFFEIDELWFVLARVAPHKQTKKVTSALHRYAMLALASQGEDNFLISTFELESSGHSYTVDTLTHFISKWEETADLFFVMGADSWSEITTWREWEKVLSLTNHIVVTRPGYEPGAQHVGMDMTQRIIDLRGLNQPAAKQIVEGQSGPRIFITDVVMNDISATDIRKAVRSEIPELTGVVAAPVADYIRKYQLYRETNEREFTD
jgi:nicotinate-nucleotide adenylyltransferase